MRAGGRKGEGEKVGRRKGQVVVVVRRRAGEGVCFSKGKARSVVVGRSHAHN